MTNQRRQMIARKTDFWNSFPTLFKITTNLIVFVLLATGALGIAALIKFLINYLM